MTKYNQPKQAFIDFTMCDKSQQASFKDCLCTDTNNRPASPAFAPMLAWPDVRVRSGDPS